MSLERTKISELTEVIPTDGAIFPLVQGGSTVSCKLSDISDFLKDITITSLSITPSTTTYEIGVNLTSLQLDWVLNKNPNDLVITRTTGGFAQTLSTNVRTFTDTFALSSGTTVWTLIATDASTSDSSAKTINWVYPFFTGMSSSDLTDGTGIYSSSDLTKLVKTKSSKTVALNDTLKYIYFAYPADHGNLSTIKDPNNFDVTNQFTKYTGNVTSTGLDNNYSSISYNIYSTYPNLVNATGDYVFNF